MHQTAALTAFFNVHTHREEEEDDWPELVREADSQQKAAGQLTQNYDRQELLMRHQHPCPFKRQKQDSLADAGHSLEL
ncbi:hypothetical protein BDDG_12103 [Blastomyces dermatitidis ATCC 18188]|uniref:Uncharacterized protein n=1 Tax=Ajellomyces dermatitidis (strain ATCC 18188 / CBS 674.68) TaxID=653446 RepID=A0A0J9EM43_AJEDA|nr:hypothetical protein BDFG_00901 [Blastomyces dermatitidis ATCC 26199]KMW67403.1 hypothetical protein BDDG_12103 [Blastomyces dermatitidis ATCC 18188]